MTDDWLGMKPDRPYRIGDRPPETFKPRDSDLGFTRATIGMDQVVLAFVLGSMLLGLIGAVYAIYHENAVEKPALHAHMHSCVVIDREPEDVCLARWKWRRQ